MISCVVCYVVLLVNHTFKTDDHHTMVYSMQEVIFYLLHAFVSHLQCFQSLGFYECYHHHHHHHHIIIIIIIIIIMLPRFKTF